MCRHSAAIEGGRGPELPVPGRAYTFGTLELAQGLGDLVALERRGRPVLRVRLGAGGLAAVEEAVTKALRSRR